MSPSTQEQKPQKKKMSYRFDVAVQEAHWVDGFNGLQDLLPKPQGGAHGEGSSGLTPPQVSQVTTLQQHGRLATT